MVLTSFFRFFTGSVLGLFSTLFLVECGLSSVLASSTVGLFGSLFLSKHKPLRFQFLLALYCGSFAGMGQNISYSKALLLASCLSFFLFFSRPFFKGFGGKLGLLAYLGSIVSELLFFLLGFQQNESVVGSDAFFSFEFPTSFAQYPLICLAAFLGFYTTVYLHHKQDKSAVFASAFPSFVLALFCWSIGTPSAALFATAFFSASFVGMVADDLLPSRHYPFLVALHSLVFFIFLENTGGYGGSLGSMAFFSVFVVVQWDAFFNRIKN